MRIYLLHLSVQGEDSDIDKFLADIEKGDRFIRVDNISARPSALVEGEKRFSYGAGW